MSKKERRQFGRTPGNAGSVSGQHRAGKRKRGVSLTKRLPRDTARVITFDIVGPDGNVAIFDVHTVEYSRTPVPSRPAALLNDRPLTREEAMRRMLAGE